MQKRKVYVDLLGLSFTSFAVFNLSKTEVLHSLNGDDNRINLPHEVIVSTQNINMHSINCICYYLWNIKWKIFLRIIWSKHLYNQLKNSKNWVIRHCNLFNFFQCCDLQSSLLLMCFFNLAALNYNMHLIKYAHTPLVWSVGGSTTEKFELINLSVLF